MSLESCRIDRPLVEPPLSGKPAGPYIIAQVVGGIAAGAVLYVIASGAPGFDVSNGFASNGYGAHSPGGYSLTSALVTEVVMTAFFLLIIIGATGRRTPAGFAPIAIGLTLTLIHLISIPVTNTSVNPARSTGVAVFVGDWAVAQLWLFWVAPIAGPCSERSPTVSSPPSRTDVSHVSVRRPLSSPV